MLLFGETWYADEKLIRDVCMDYIVNENDFVEKNMDFDDNDIVWKCYEAKQTVRRVTEYCKKNDIPFFMRSKPAVEYIRNNIK